MIRYLIAVFFIILSSYSISAQTNCERNLNEARADFTSGNLYAIPGKLTDCIKEGFSKTEKIEAYRLLTLTYLNINQQEKAKESLIKLLKIKTDYQVIANVDPPELYSLYRKIDTKPIYFIGISGGLNYNTIQIPDPEKDRYTVNSSSNDNYEYAALLSWQAGGQFIYPLLDKVWLKGGIAFQKNAYEYTETIINNNESDNNTVINFESENTGVNLSVSARTIMDYYYWKPYVDFGFTGRYNLNHNMINYSSAYSKSFNEENISIIRMDDFRKDFNVGFNVHVGTMFKIWTYYGELSLGATKYFLIHANYENDTQRINNTIANSGQVIEDDFVNLVYELNFAFNIPFFNFK